MEFRESRTYRNLLKAYEDELMLSARFNLYGAIAQVDGYIAISRLYQTVAGQDLEHARIWLRQINEGVLPDTATNLSQSANAENAIAGNEYQQFVEVAREEGYEHIAALFAGIANIDYYHGAQFQQQYDNVITNQVFCKPEETFWICMECGNIMSGLCAPEICPVCGFPQGFYRPLNSCPY
ncbi:rubrerythrin family protein [Kineothrix sp. MB12-C1]|uniref:rubrerythrin family protein n=1 Tax=Kineothrix sp. MB12-C1 TaxID=3070215 RepID=UPI0027D203EE|nr:ferritin family protein [Kineothrix sp. MB12-C1]WMC92073.1 ferritin family protein [Kineothrix sp. MB12-C1]